MTSAQAQALSDQFAQILGPWWGPTIEPYADGDTAYIMRTWSGPPSCLSLHLDGALSTYDPNADLCTRTCEGFDWDVWYDYWDQVALPPFPPPVYPFICASSNNDGNLYCSNYTSDPQEILYANPLIHYRPPFLVPTPF